MVTESSLSGLLHAATPTIQALIAALPDALIVVAENGRIVLANERLQSFLGFEEDELLDQSVDFLLPSHLRQWYRQQVDSDVFTNTYGWPVGPAFNTRLQHRDGDEVAVVITSSWLETADGRFIVGIIRPERPVTPDFVPDEKQVDELEALVKQRTVELSAANKALQSQINQRQQVEAALKESERQYRTLIEQSNDAIYLLFDERFEMINQRFARMFNVTLDEVRAPDFNFLQLVAPESIDLILERDRLLQIGEIPSPHYEFTALTADGRRIFLDASVSYIDYRGGIATQGILRDITERKQSERDLRRRATELEALAEISSALRIAGSVEEVMFALLHNLEIVGEATSSIFLVDPEDGSLVARGWHPSNPKLVGLRYQPGEGITGQVALTGKPYMTRDLNQDPQARIFPKAAAPMALIQSAISLPLQAGERIVGVLNLGLHEPRDFSEEEMRVLTAVAEMAGSTLQRVMILETLEQRVQERTHELAEANRQLLELDRLKSKFISDVSHELRTPVTNLSLYADLLERSTPEKYGRYIAILKNEARRLAQLIADILDLARLELEQEEIQLTPLSLNRLVRQAVAAHELHARANNATLSFEPAPDLRSIAGSASHLTRVVTNLLVNALNFTTAGSIELRTFAVQKGNQICLEISDSGQGIDPEEMPHIFKRFYRGQRVSQSTIPGTGLGLAIVREIVELHRGTIEVESRLGEGTTFRIFLPTVDA